MDDGGAGSGRRLTLWLDALNINGLSNDGLMPGVSEVDEWINLATAHEWVANADNQPHGTAGGSG